MGKFKLFVYIIPILFLTVLNDIPSCSASAVDAANAGIKANENGDKDKAKVLFRSALSSNELSKKNYMIVNNNLCRILESESNIQAIDCYTKTLYLSGDNAQARRSRGALYGKIGAHEKAIEDLSHYILLSPKDEFGYIHRALSLGAIKKFDQAISDLNTAIKLRPKKREGYIRRGNTYFKTGNYNLALADFEKAIAVDPESSSVYQAMAWFYATCPERDFRDGATALKFAETSIEIEKKRSTPRLYDTLAAAYAELGQFQNAIETQKQALELLKKEKNYLDSTKEQIRNRLGLYKSKKAYRTMRNL